MKRLLILGALAALYPLRRWAASDPGPCWRFAHAWDDLYEDWSEDPSSVVEGGR